MIVCECGSVDVLCKIYCILMGQPIFCNLYVSIITTQRANSDVTYLCSTSNYIRLLSPDGMGSSVILICAR